LSLPASRAASTICRTRIEPRTPALRALPGVFCPANPSWQRPHDRDQRQAERFTRHNMSAGRTGYGAGYGKPEVTPSGNVPLGDTTVEVSAQFLVTDHQRPGICSRAPWDLPALFRSVTSPRSTDTSESSPLRTREWPPSLSTIPLTQARRRINADCSCVWCKSSLSKFHPSSRRTSVSYDFDHRKYVTHAITASSQKGSRPRC